MDSILSRPIAGLSRPTDAELLKLIDDLFHVCFPETPFRARFDPLIEQLSFTRECLDEADTEDLKRKWTSFLKRSEREFSWPLNAGMAEWYARHHMVSHAIAVYEHLYACIRRGELHEECPESFEEWLVDLLHLCQERNLTWRTRHLCEVIEDFYHDGYVSTGSYVEALSLLPELSRAAIRQEIESDRASTEQRLRSEQRELLDELHHLTRKLLVEAELWSDPHWREVEPSAAPLRRALALESEFHHKVFLPHRRELETLLGDNAPGPKRTCGLSQMIELLEKAGSNTMGATIVREVLQTLHGGRRLASNETLRRLRTIRDHRNAIAHVRRGRPYTTVQCSEFLRIVRDSHWAFEFLTDIQHE